MKKTIVLIAMLEVTALFLIGCGPADPYAPVRKLFRPSPDTDVTSSPRYNFSSFSGTVWKTKVRTAVADLKRYTGAHDITLLPPDCFDPTDPKYNPPHDMGTMTMLPIGTRLRIERLMQDNGAAGFVMVTATLLDETNVQKIVNVERLFLANNQFIARGPTSSTNWGVNPDMLEK